MKLIIKCLLLLLFIAAASCQCIIGNTSSNATCPSSCTGCLDNLTCTSCCWRYYVDSGGRCRPCTDPNCAKCLNSIPSSSSCIRCDYSYGLVSGSPSTCQLCTDAIAVQCSSLNNCTVSSACINCFHTYVVLDNVCRTCASAWVYCQQCTTTRCTSCGWSRYLNTTTNQQCVLCSAIPYCTKCTNGPICITCDPGYFVDNGTCLECRFPCLTCTSRNTCQSCNSTTQEFLLYSGSCVPCWEHPQTQNCSLCTFSGPTTYTCQKCLDGFYLSGSTCQLCIDPCSTCSGSANCTSCVSLQYAIVSALCQFCNATLAECLLCYDQFVCIECQPQFTVNISSPLTAQCIPCQLVYQHCETCSNTQCLTCLEGYTIGSDSQTCVELPCSDPCLACKNTSTALCLTCIQGYFYNTSTNYTCSQCPTGCTACQSQLLCTTCLPTYVNTNGSCQTCPLYTYYSTQGDVCRNCSQYCQTCDIDNCLTCDQFTSIQTVDAVDLCRDICGDGILLDYDCDLKVTALPDGCSNNCQIQQNFNCSYTPQTFNASGGSITVNTSVCSFIGSVSISVEEARQVIAENTMIVTYKIQPYLSGMPLSTDTQSYLQSIFGLTSSHLLGGYAIAVDQTQGTVSFTISYDQDLSEADLTLEINFDALSSTSIVLQYLTNTSSTTPISSIKQNGCLGEYSDSQSLMLSTVIYYSSLVLSLFGLVLFLIGAFTKELAGLEQMLLFQSIFSVLLFSDEKVTMAVLSLKGFKYALGVQLPDSLAMSSSSSGYFLETSSHTMAGYYTINFFLFLVPLGALVCLLYRLKHKDFPYKAEMGKHAEEFFRGELMLYISVFNIFPLVVFSRLFLTFRDDFFFWDLPLAILSVLVIAYSLIMYVQRPEIVGIFRSAFRSFSQSRQGDSQAGRCSLLTARICESRFGDCYSRYSTNHYYLFILYLISSSVIVVVEMPFRLVVLTALQGSFLLVLVAAKPYFNPVEKFRSILMFSALILTNFIQNDLGGTYTLPLVLIGMCVLHLLLTIWVLIRSLVDQIKRRFNDRTEVVKRMFKVDEQMKATDNLEKQQIEKKALRELINRFNLSHSKQLFPLNSGNKPASIQMSQHTPEVPDSEQRELNEDVIIDQENEHLRYQRGLYFFDKYGKEFSKDLVAEHYGQI